MTGERARIARELHDIVAHSMSQISVQAGMGRMLAESQPRRATESLAAIEELSRGTLAEMRRLTAALRVDQTEEAGGLRPSTPWQTSNSSPRPCDRRASRSRWWSGR